MYVRLNMDTFVAQEREKKGKNIQGTIQCLNAFQNSQENKQTIIFSFSPFHFMIDRNVCTTRASLIANKQEQHSIVQIKLT